MAIQISGNTLMAEAFAGTALSAVGREHYKCASDTEAGVFVFNDATAVVEVIASGNVPANISEIAGVTEYLPAKTNSGASGEQYAAGDMASVITSRRVWVQAAEDSTGSIQNGVPAYCRIDTTIDGHATDTSTSNILVGVFRSALNSNGAALVELRMGN